MKRKIQTSETKNQEKGDNFVGEKARRVENKEAVKKKEEKTKLLEKRKVKKASKTKKRAIGHFLEFFF